MLLIMSSTYIFKQDSVSLGVPTKSDIRRRTSFFFFFHFLHRSFVRINIILNIRARFETIGYIQLPRSLIIIVIYFLDIFGVCRYDPVSRPIPPIHRQNRPQSDWPAKMLKIVVFFFLL